jgi:hypothetical protein
MKKIILIILSIYSSLAYSQNYSFQWSHTIGAASTNDHASVMKEDNGGNVYISGLIRNSSTGSIPMTHSGYGSNATDLYITILDAAGTVIRTQIFPAMGGGALAEIYDMAIGNSGEVFFCGLLSQVSIDFDPETGVNFLSASGGNNGTICALTPAGDLNWLGRIESIERVNKVFINSNNELTFAGTFFNNGGSIDMDISAGTSNMSVGSSGCRREPSNCLKTTFPKHYFIHTSQEVIWINKVDDTFA